MGTDSDGIPETAAEELAIAMGCNFPAPGNDHFGTKEYT